MSKVEFVNAAAEFVYTRTYSRWMEEEGRRETWPETVQRYITFLEQHAGDRVPQKVFRKAEEYMLKFGVMGSMRAVWSAGEAATATNVAMYNCLTSDAEFISSQGVRRIGDCEDGERVQALTHTGSWKDAVVRRYGRRPINKIVLQKGGNGKPFNVKATPDHRWLLQDGSVTTRLSEGDVVLSSPCTWRWDFGDADPDERTYWCYGYVYGDGAINGNYSHVRLCGKDAEFAKRFEDCGFKTSTNDSLKGDFYAYTGSYQKTLPDLNKDPINLIRAFVAGFMDADESRNPNKPEEWLSIQQTGRDGVEFIRKAFPMCGLYIVSEQDLTGQKTNFGTRPFTIRFRLSENRSSAPQSQWRVRSIGSCGEDDTWCLEVEDDQSFVLPNGIVTGNCAFQAIDCVDAFAECLYVLMCGTGYGFSVEKRYVDKLPEVKHLQGDGAGTFVIPDSKEGWADSVKHLMTALYSGKDLELDYTQLRPKGARLKTFGGRSSGPAPLIALHEFIRKTFTDAQGRKLKPIECHDILNKIAEIVVVGGVRRSSQISLSDLDDDDIREAKFWPYPLHRAMSNNSAIYREKPGAITFMGEWHSLAKSGTGERGIFNLGGAIKRAPERRKTTRLAGTNPCGEIVLRSCEFCNLTEVVLRAGDDLDDILDKVETAVWLGAIQSTFTNFPYLSQRWKRNCNEERLLGVSITGQMDNIALMNSEALKAAKAKAIKIAKKAAKVLGVNASAAVTCVKPSGTVSQLVNSSSGLHPRYARFYLRRYRIASIDPLFRLLKDQGLSLSPEVGQRPEDWKKAQQGDTTACTIYEKGKRWTEDKVITWVVGFPVAAPESSITRDQLSAIEQLEHYKKVQEHWCEHNASATIYVKEDEWLEVGNWVYKNWKHVTGVSFLPYDGGRYELAPYEEITEEEYRMLEDSFPTIDYSKLSKYELEDNTSGSKELACSGDACEI